MNSGNRLTYYTMEGGGCPPFVLLHFTLWLVGDTCDSDKNLPVWRGDGKQARYKELLEPLCHPPVGFAFLHNSVCEHCEPTMLLAQLSLTNVRL